MSLTRRTDAELQAQHQNLLWRAQGPYYVSGASGQKTMCNGWYFFEQMEHGKPSYCRRTRTSNMIIRFCSRSDRWVLSSPEGDPYFQHTSSGGKPPEGNWTQGGSCRIGCTCEACPSKSCRLQKTMPGQCPECGSRLKAGRERICQECGMIQKHFQAEHDLTQDLIDGRIGEEVEIEDHKVDELKGQVGKLEYWVKNSDMHTCSWLVRLETRATLFMDPLKLRRPRKAVELLEFEEGQQVKLELLLANRLGQQAPQIGMVTRTLLEQSQSPWSVDSQSGFLRREEVVEVLWPGKDVGEKMKDGSVAIVRKTSHEGVAADGYRTECSTSEQGTSERQSSYEVLSEPESDTTPLAMREGPLPPLPPPAAPPTPSVITAAEPGPAVTRAAVAGVAPVGAAVAGAAGWATAAGVAWAGAPEAEEAERQVAEEAKRKQEKAAKRAEEENQLQKEKARHEEEEEKRREEEEKKRAEEDRRREEAARNERKRMEEEERKRAEEDRRREEAARKDREERERKQEEDRRRAEENQRRAEAARKDQEERERKEDEERKRTEEYRRREEAARKDEEEREPNEDEERKRAEEYRRREEAARKDLEERERKEDEDRKRAEEYYTQQTEEAARKDREERQRMEEEERERDEEDRQREEAARKDLEERRPQEEEARKRAQEEVRRHREEAARKYQELKHRSQEEEDPQKEEAAREEKEERKQQEEEAEQKILSSHKHYIEDGSVRGGTSNTEISDEDDTEVLSQDVWKRASNTEFPDEDDTEVLSQDVWKRAPPYKGYYPAEELFESEYPGGDFLKLLFCGSPPEIDLRDSDASSSCSCSLESLSNKVKEALDDVIEGNVNDDYANLLRYLPRLVGKMFELRHCSEGAVKQEFQKILGPKGFLQRAFQVIHKGCVQRYGIYERANEVEVYLLLAMWIASTTQKRLNTPGMFCSIDKSGQPTAGAKALAVMAQDALVIAKIELPRGERYTSRAYTEVLGCALDQGKTFMLPLPTPPPSAEDFCADNLDQIRTTLDVGNEGMNWRKEECLRSEVSASSSLLEHFKKAISEARIAHDEAFDSRGRNQCPLWNTACFWFHEALISRPWEEHLLRDAVSPLEYETCFKSLVEHHQEYHRGKRLRRATDCTFASFAKLKMIFDAFKEADCCSSDDGATNLPRCFEEAQPTSLVLQMFELMFSVTVSTDDFHNWSVVASGTAASGARLLKDCVYHRDPQYYLSSGRLFKALKHVCDHIFLDSQALKEVCDLLKTCLNPDTEPNCPPDSEECIRLSRTNGPVSLEESARSFNFSRIAQAKAHSIYAAHCMVVEGLLQNLHQAMVEQVRRVKIETQQMLEGLCRGLVELTVRVHQKTFDPQDKDSETSRVLNSIARLHLGCALSFVLLPDEDCEAVKMAHRCGKDDGSLTFGRRSGLCDACKSKEEYMWFCDRCDKYRCCMDCHIHQEKKVRSMHVQKTPSNCSINSPPLLKKFVNGGRRLVKYPAKFLHRGQTS